MGGEQGRHSFLMTFSASFSQNQKETPEALVFREVPNDIFDLILKEFWITNPERSEKED